jgi:hypothetical protein
VARRPLATLLVVVATVLLAAGLVLAHGDRTTEPARVGDHAVALLHDATVRDALVREAVSSITSEVSEASGVPAAAIRPEVEPIVPRVVDDAAFVPAWRAAAERTTRQITGTRHRRVALSVRDLDAVVTDAVGPLPAVLAAGLRAAGDVDVVSFRRGATTIDRTRQLERAFDLGRPCLVAAAVLALLALLVSPRRRSTLLLVGVGCVVAGLGVVAVELAGRALVLGGVEDRADRDVTAAVWDELLGGLRTQAVVVGAVGIALAGIAAAVRPQRPAGPVRGLGR